MPRRMPEAEPWGQWSARVHADCGPLAAAAWAAIRWRMGPCDEAAAVSLADLAAVLARSPRTVKEALRRLAALGWLEVRRTGRENLLKAVLSPPEHIERGEKLPLRGAKTCPSEGQKVAPQRGENLPLGRPPPNNPPVAVEKRGEGGQTATTTAPPPSMPATPATTATPAATPILDLAARAFARFDGRAGLLEVRGHIESDLAAGAYAPADLAAYLATGGAPAWPSQLKLVVKAHAEAARRAALSEAIRRIRANGLTRAVYVRAVGGEGGRTPRTATVRYADPGAGLVVLEELIGGRAGATAEALRAQMAAAEEAADTPVKRDMLPARLKTLGERLAAVEAGRPDPAARAPERRRTDLAAAEALAEWRFEPEEPTLFSLDAGTDVMGSSSCVNGQEGKP